MGLELAAAPSIAMPALAFLPGGDIFIGAQKTDPTGRNFSRNAQADEGPVHQRRVGPIAVAKTAVTVGMFRDGYMKSGVGRFAGAAVDPLGRRILMTRTNDPESRQKPYVAVHADGTLKLSDLVEEPNLDSDGRLVNHGLFETIPPPNWLDDLDPAFRDAQSPVARMSLFDALGFLQWINTVNPIVGTHIEIGGKTYVFGHWRLMTETEWEYAARGPQGTNEYPVNQKLFAEAGNKMTPKLAQYHPSGKVAIVGSKPPLEWSNGFSLVHNPLSKQWLVSNGAQLFDMAGNLWEWTETRYGPYAPGASIYGGPSSDPTNVVRGGSWSVSAKDARSAYRCHYYPVLRNVNFGFRLVSPLSPLQDSK